MLNSLVKYVAIIEIHYHNVTTQHLTVLHMAYEKNVKVHIVTDIKVNQKASYIAQKGKYKGQYDAT